MFNRKQDVHKVDGFGPFLGPIYPPPPPWETQNIAKNQNFFQKLHHSDYQIIQVPGNTNQITESQNSYKIN